MRDLRQIIVDNTSHMLDNPEDGIYPTTEFYNNLEKDIRAWALDIIGPDIPNLDGAATYQFHNKRLRAMREKAQP